MNRRGFRSEIFDDIDEYELIRADQVRAGHYLDLEHDRYADPKHDNAHFQFELAAVSDTELETPQCVCLYIEGVDAFGFPVGHMLKRAKWITSEDDPATENAQ